jgi:Bacterial protein of unknown function (DUF885)
MNAIIKLFLYIYNLKKNLMKNCLFSISMLFLLTSCSQKDTNQTFDKYKNTFVENLWKISPDWASSQGYHKYDAVLIIPNIEFRETQMSFIKQNLDSLKKYPINDLNVNNKTDFYMIKNQLESMDFYINEYKSYQWNPSEYNVCGAFSEILNGSYDSLDNRLKNFNLKMSNIPAFYEAAKVNIKNPTLEHTQLSIDQNLGGLSVFQTDLVNELAKSKLSEPEKQDILQNAKKSEMAILDFTDWLKKLDNTTPKSFRLGTDLYEKKFNFDIQSGYSSDGIYQKAVLHKTDLHDKMFELSEKLWTKYMGNATKPMDRLVQIKQVIDKISLQHTTPENFQSEIQKQIPELTAYVKAKNLLYIDPSKPLVVRKEPDYMAGVAGASISAPGPYDKNANTYYNVGSMSGWDKARSESYLREYNDYILQILNIHEAIPGHYTQLVYSNQSPSIIKSIFGNGAMIEGWAVYSEKMMLESGYNTTDEMMLMYYKWNLRSTCNTILDISVHTKDMTKEQALNLLINEAFQQQAEADGKWKRVSLTQVQLCSYFAGYTEIYEFRESLKKEDKDFDLKKFHEKFLSYGSAPVKYIKELYTKK